MGGDGRRGLITLVLAEVGLDIVAGSGLDDANAVRNAVANEGSIFLSSSSSSCVHSFA